MKTLIRTVALLLVLAALIPSVAACNSSGNKDTTTTTTEDPSKEPVRDSQAILMGNKYAVAGAEYVLTICKKYYNDRTHIVYRGMSQKYAAEIWYVASYIEMLAEAYRLYPDNAEIKKYYLYALDKCLPQYLVSNVRVTTPDRTASGLSYYNAGHRSSGDFYYDDNAWICWQLFEAYELLKEDKYLKQANDVLEFLINGWRDNGGGIYWDKTHKGIGTCSTAPTICCLMKSYELTKNEEHLALAKEYYAWANEKLLDKGTGLYFAGIGDPWQPSYDQGTMILSGIMLYEATQEDEYYAAAKKTAARCVTHSFDIKGNRKEYTVEIRENPYYCSWAFSWLVRGTIRYINASEKQNELFMNYLKQLLDTRFGTQNKKTGLYDHYFGTASAGWVDSKTDTSKMFESDDLLLMPTGYATMLLLCGYYDAYVSDSVAKAQQGQ